MGWILVIRGFAGTGVEVWFVVLACMAVVLRVCGYWMLVGIGVKGFGLFGLSRLLFIVCKLGNFMFWYRFVVLRVNL